ncbi:DEAD box ATP-dependent RNA helicase, putative [Entamoeba invadens IP1]|uniref:DEAD box ATP-dependent RNA helicase, putative n=1 Tax=Entamoeba invadens IP1 TaxID=370355 RepID=UPI0002C3F37D|nr:DEAD box ATP-dependent RNA helicase, putative [Entamoeba invadens IP1]ELP93440.1 DEAD box ATP-dependent RNA helicase, putative [Entamoeba invadens IP1]|eukprot:XP_004260211.1 DEAD box ATP-dependent RNA helicase, putative [Entamoeba invadens IP1]
MENDNLLDKSKTFANFGLDDFLSHQINRLGYKNPTLIQSQFIPIALEGKDIITEARTGTGKTLAYVIPILQNLLTTKSEGNYVRALILNPSRELCVQVKNVVDQLLKGFYGISIINVASDTSMISQKGKTRGLPDIVTATPSSLLTYLKRTGTNLSTLDMVVYDEVDLMIAYGYEKDITQISKTLPETCKKWLLSATINDDVETIKKLTIRNAVKIRLEDEGEKGNITEYSIFCEQKDKILNLYIILRLNMIRGKVLIFVNSIQQAFFVKIFLDRFSIPSVVLNSDFPRDIRTDIINQFNNKQFKILIATDEVTIEKVIEEKAKDLDAEEGKENFSVARGIDFVDVATVMNFDCPVSDVSYTHRIGRTARGIKKGTAITFVDKSELEQFSEIKTKHTLKTYVVDPVILNSFKTRVYDAQNTITKNTCKLARIRDFKEEKMNLETLKNSVGSGVSHTTQLAAAQNHLRDIPDYLLPKNVRERLGRIVKDKSEYEFYKTKNVPKWKNERNPIRKRRNATKPRKDDRRGVIAKLTGK